MSTFYTDLKKNGGAAAPKTGNFYTDLKRAKQARGPAAAKPDGGGDNVFERWLHGAEEAVHGFIPALAMLGTAAVRDLDANIHGRPTGIAEGGGELGKKVIYPVAQAYRDKYISKDVLSNMWEDPFGTSLDVATLGTLGAARAFALSTLPKNATLAEKAAALAKGQYQGPLRTIDVGLEGGGRIATRTLPRQGARAARMIVADRLLKTLVPDDAPVLGQNVRAARAVKNETRQIELRLLASPEYEAYQKAYSKLNVRQRVALHTLNRVPLPADLAAWRAMIPADDKAAQRLAKQLDDPKILALYEDGVTGTTKAGKRIAAAHAAATALSGLRTRLTVGRGDLTPETAAEAPYRQTRVARGAEFAPDVTPVGADTPVGSKVRVAGKKDIGARLIQVDGDEALVYTPRFNTTERVALADLEVQGESQLRGGWRGTPPLLASQRATVERLEGLNGGGGGAAGLARQRLARMEREHSLWDAPYGSHAQIAREIEAAGRPQPFWEPDQMAARGFGFSRRSSGLTAPKSDVHAYQGDLFRRGLVALHTDTLGPAFLRAAVLERAAETHRLVVQMAVPSPDGKLATGYRWVRETRGQQFGHVATNYGEHIGNIDDTMPHDLRVTLDDTGSNPVGGAVDAEGRFLMVPERFAKTMEADLAKGASAARRWLWDGPTAVWRALVLKVRVPWLENNIVGNTVMATVRFSGPAGLVAVLGMIQETKGVKAARRALRMAESNGKHLPDSLLREKLPELSRKGTFYDSQLPTGTLASRPKLQRTLRPATGALDVLPGIDRRTEGALRRAAAETVLRGSQEVKAIYRAMPKQTRTWAAAADKALDNLDLRRLVVREVNDAMGNFLSLTATEQNSVRALIPFYAWFREISRIAAKLPVDAPGRSLLLAQLGAVGAASSDETLGGLPTYLRGVVPYGKPQGDIQNVLALRGANPYISAVDVLSGRNPVGELNPFIAAAVSYLGDVNPQEPASLYNVIPRALLDTFTRLPEYQLYEARESKLYPTRTREDLILQFLGDYRRQISLQQAHFYAEQGR